MREAIELLLGQTPARCSAQSSRQGRTVRPRFDPVQTRRRRSFGQKCSTGARSCLSCGFALAGVDCGAWCDWERSRIALQSSVCTTCQTQNPERKPAGLALPARQRVISSAVVCQSINYGVGTALALVASRFSQLGFILATAHSQVRFAIGQARSWILHHFRIVVLQLSSVSPALIQFPQRRSH